MRWKTKKSNMPEVGTLRRRIAFALFPVRTMDGMTVWLEKYLAVDKFRRTTPPHGDPGWWKVQSWSQASTMWNEWHEKV